METLQSWHSLGSIQRTEGKNVSVYEGLDGRRILTGVVCKKNDDFFVVPLRLVASFRRGELGTKEETAIKQLTEKGDVAPELIENLVFRIENTTGEEA